MERKVVYLRVGKKGEIYTTKEVRLLTGIKPSGYVAAKIVGRKLVIEAVPSVEELLERPKKVRLTVEEFERLSEEAQREALGL